MTDSRNGKKYKTIAIGEQVWMAENLNYNIISETPSLENNSKCYDDDEINTQHCEITGRLYTWAVAIDSAKMEKNNIICGYGKSCNLPDKVQGICPDGWHLPSYTEWNTLTTFVVGDNYYYSSYIAEELKSKTGWHSIDGYCYGGCEINGKDTYGFTAVPNGSDFWSSTDSDDENSQSAYIFAIINIGYSYSSSNIISTSPKNDYHYIRCIQDKATTGN